ncbi:hypothetical protein BGZ70_001225 [Mortierella alpina]|uniref:DUF202 domain-containing protein n=1 Tax=Mortierella alpina TaxID=64518 RepID=A0A9P6IY48_MORAP|nr:hypothetical protein BGZ70_001225 [Mortierella alpina]
MDAQQLHPFDTASSTPAQTRPSTDDNSANKTHARHATLIGTADPAPKAPLPSQLRNRAQAASSPSSDTSLMASASAPDASTSCIGHASTMAASESSAPKPPARRNTGPGGRYIPAEDEELPLKAWTHRVSDLLRELYARYSPSLTLENKGSIARDHLANERTYLAWLRSSLSLITVGVAITQLFRLQNTSSSGSGTPTQPTPELIKISELGRPLGGSFIALGILFLWLGTSRYFHNQSVLSYGQFPASRGSVILATVTVMAVLLACFILVIIQGRTH